MRHRHLTHDAFTAAAIEDILARGKLPDWAPLIEAIQADPMGDVAEKTRVLCQRPLYAAPVFRRVIAAARQSRGRPLDLDTGTVANGDIAASADR